MARASRARGVSAISREASVRPSYKGLSGQDRAKLSQVCSGVSRTGASSSLEDGDFRPLGSGRLKTTAARSALMSRIRQRGTTAEIAVGRELSRRQHRYRKNVRSLPGSPDFANKSGCWAVFVHGCFWHRHAGCVRTTMPKTNRSFWMEKFSANIDRDERSVAALKAMGYRVAIVWECEALRGDFAGKLDILESRAVDVRDAIDHGSVLVDVPSGRSGRARGKRDR